MSNIVISTIQRASTGKWEVNSVGENLRTNDGVNWQAAVMGGGWGDVSVTGNYPVRIAYSGNRGLDRTVQWYDELVGGTDNEWHEPRHGHVQSYSRRQFVYADCDMAEHRLYYNGSYCWCGVRVQ
jgi:hypothetical protein